eukprot:15482406-Alexandrium_andersonii.AAC.1
MQILSVSTLKEPRSTPKACGGLPPCAAKKCGGAADDSGELLTDIDEIKRRRVKERRGRLRRGVESCGRPLRA